MQYKNPENGLVYSTSFSWVFALLFGWLYFMVKGAWGAVFRYLFNSILIAAVIIGAGFLITGGQMDKLISFILAGVFIGPVLVHIYYTIKAGSIIGDTYLNRGYTVV